MRFLFIKRTYCSTMQHVNWSVSLVINFGSSRFVRWSYVITFLFPNTIERSLSVKYFTTSKYSKLLLIYYLNGCACVLYIVQCAIQPSPPYLSSFLGVFYFFSPTYQLYYVYLLYNILKKYTYRLPLLIIIIIILRCPYICFCTCYVHIGDTVYIIIRSVAKLQHSYKGNRQSVM